MSMIDTLPRSRSYSTIRVDSDGANDSHWLYMHAGAGGAHRPCFHPALMREMHTHLASISHIGQRQQGPQGQLNSLVLASDSNVFNLGGDLELFGQYIRRRDRAGLLAYAMSCIKGVDQFHQGLDGSFRTIALLQGDALGGGLEMALSCHLIVAEEDVGMGLPEILFGLFPGMGAYSFLSRRVAPNLAEKIIMEGRIYSSQEMHRMGIVDVLVPKGDGVAAVQELIRQQRRAPLAQLAMNAIRNVVQPVRREELVAVTEIWVDTALTLGEKSLRTMDRLVRAQTRRAQAGVAA
ncbi:crotonase/enoyl-CoA hydratase family protein [Xanthomonas translucens]|uniref:Enoyl-CoA hydratase n=2 Tax=Xanthomonas campestris pv. translucens TaxID=343 RepID=A0A125PWK5_XANCT|nr:crotonase/enoyl-CoA hydratase family protein [Xanthomonas translucens]KTF37456.1 enoyl-CoA hydratase [Xanthomonas translucens pv. translucens]KWV12437.1 enoyl-CoA hydratase [Xanthomonas translucens]KWV16702.1 enoyl-CoA hydratase [Xanthomonas translucens]MCS3360416.1 crotonase/enoyl-CoA hydratase family protein [Xanthomonas translucens pv. translucens]MCS3373476.1 crotonase/enoyl-CoA hydratase family protein [Xanthomonas translucens pv. translucens]